MHQFEDVGIKKHVSTWKTQIFSGFGRMAEELGWDWGHCGSLHCCGQQGGTCELWLSGDARSSDLDHAPARGKEKDIEIRKLPNGWDSFMFQTEVRLMRLMRFVAVCSAWKHERLSNGWRYAKSEKATRSVERDCAVMPQASEMQGQCVLWKGELLSLNVDWLDSLDMIPPLIPCPSNIGSVYLCPTEAPTNSDSIFPFFLAIRGFHGEIFGLTTKSTDWRVVRYLLSAARLLVDPRLILG